MFKVFFIFFLFLFFGKRLQLKHSLRILSPLLGQLLQIRLTYHAILDRIDSSTSYCYALCPSARGDRRGNNYKPQSVERWTKTLNKHEHIEHREVVMNITTRIYTNRLIF